MSSSFFKYMLLAVSVAVPTTSFAGTYWNPDYSWAHYWEDSTLSIKLFDDGAGAIGGYAAGESTGDYNISTDLTISIVASGEDVTIVEDNYGEFPFGGTQRTWAAARPKNSSGQWCVSLTPYPTFNGNCTTSSSNHAVSGKIYVNTYYLGGQSWEVQKWTLSHELGHIIGLYHSDPEVSFSLMRASYNDAVYTDMEAALKTFINAVY